MNDAPVSPQSTSPAWLTRNRALGLLGLITALGAWFRFYNLGWGAPYYHFHIDEHFVFSSADMLRRDAHEAAMSPKFFMYSPLLPYLINGARAGYEALAHPLNLGAPADEVTYMILGRALSAAFGTATILLAYGVGTRVAGRVAGLLSAFFLAVAVLHLRDSHFATTDVPMTFFALLALWFSLRLADKGDMASLIGAGLAFGGAILCKYTGAFSLGIIGIAYLMSPRRPKTLQPLGAWAVWVLRGIVPIVVGVGSFLILDPLVWQYPAKFQADIKEWVTDPLTGVTKPIWAAQFADIGIPEFYWFTNLLWWGVGPALEALALVGLVYLISRWNKRAGLAAAFPIVYFLAAGRSIAPFARYALPLMPAVAIAAGVVAAAWLAQPRARWLARTVVGATMAATFLYAVAYMNVFRQPDSRLEASSWMASNVPPGSRVLVEPSQNTPPTGEYRTDMDFNHDYVFWGGNSRGEAERERQDFYHLFTLDTYKYLYNDRLPDDEKKQYIASRLAQVDWILTDDTLMQFYQHLPSSRHRVVKEFYRDLLAGRLGFTLARSFKVYPSIFGKDINDDSAELTFRLFDHPRVFIFMRTVPIER